MRTVANALSVKAMSLYRYVAGKEDLLLGVADLVLSEIAVPKAGTPWREAMYQRAMSARRVMLNHPSAALVLESCASMTPARLGYCNAIIGLLIEDGFSATGAYRAFLLLDSYIYGFTMQELSWPRGEHGPAAAETLDIPPTEFPHFALAMEAAMQRVTSRGLQQSYSDEFSVGLELVLNAILQLRQAP